MKLDATACQLIRPRLDAALAALGRELGLQIKARNASYNSSHTNCTFKLELATIGESGEVETKEAAAYRELHQLYGLPADGLGRMVPFNGEHFTIMGLLPKSDKYPLLARRATDGKQFKLPKRALVPLFANVPVR